MSARTIALPDGKRIPLATLRQLIRDQRKPAAEQPALLRGDTAERDRLVRRAEQLMKAEHYGDAVQRVLTVDFYVNRRGVAYRSIDLARAGGIIQ